MIREALARLIGARSRAGFLPLETAVLQELIARLPASARGLAEAQVAAVNLIQRHRQSREVNMYAMVAGRPRPPRDAAFPNQTEELCLARMRFRCTGRTVFEVSFFTVHGVLFSLEFAPSPAGAHACAAITVEGFELLADPMLSATDPTPAASLPHAWLALCAEHGPCSMHGPVRGASVDEWPNRLGTSLPADYLELMRAASTLQSPEFQVRSIAALATGTVDAVDYLLLADVSTVGVVGVRRGGSDPTLTVLPFDGGPPATSGASLSDLIRDLLDRRGPFDAKSGSQAR